MQSPWCRVKLEGAPAMYEPSRPVIFELFGYILQNEKGRSQGFLN